MEKLSETMPIHDGYDVRAFSNDRVSAASCSITGRVRPANEDNCGYLKDSVNGDLFVVCDGMGGHVGGAVASKMAVDAIIGYLSSQKFNDIVGAMRDALQLANQIIIDKTKSEPSLKGMGTTACILVVQDGLVRIAHIGDSRIYLYASDTGVLHRITKDHSYVQRLIDVGELNDWEAETHPNKNIILKALGVKPTLTFHEGDVPEEPVIPMEGDVFMLCSDGLSGMLNDDHIEVILRGRDDIDGKIRQLLSEANAEGKGVDNITVQLIKINKSGGQVRQFVDYNPEWRMQKAFVRTMEIPVQKPVQEQKGKSSWIWYVLAMLAAMIVSSFVTMTLLGDKVKDSSDKVEKNVVPSLNLTERTKINRQIDDLNSKIKIYKDSIDRISKTIERVNKEKDALSRDSDLGTAAFTDLLKGHQSKKDSLESELNGFETKKKELLAQLKGSVEKPSEEVKKDKEKKETVKEKSDTSLMDRIVNRIGISRQQQKAESK